jgi:hypothetical protein
MMDGYQGCSRAKFEPTCGMAVVTLIVSQVPKDQFQTVFSLYEHGCGTITRQNPAKDT